MNLFYLNSFYNLDLLSVGVAIASIGLLGFVTFFSARKEKIAEIFLGMCLMAVFWSVFNYISYQSSDRQTVLWLIRFAVFFAIWFSYYIFLLFYSFPEENNEFGSWPKKLFLKLTIGISALNLSPFVFKSVEKFSADGRVEKINNGPGIILFGISVILLIAFGAYALIKKAKKTSSLKQKHQIHLILVGVLITSLLLIIFNYIFPALLNIPKFVPLGAVFLFPFIAFTSYAIIKHRLFNVKVIATEILMFVLSIVTFIEIVLSKEPSILIFRTIVFLLVLTFGVLLIKSVRKEVEQRELLEVLTKKLEDANEKLKALDIARSEFITIASHQLRTPPATIKWYLSSVLAGDFGKLTDEQKNVVDKAFRTNNSQISLIDDMLNVSRIERGKMEFLFEKINLLPLAQITYEQLIPQATDRGLKLSLTEPAKPLPEIMADKEKIRQVMNNLIDNAIKYTKTGSVTAKLWEEGGNIKFSVTDTGKGIAPEEANSIFEKFSRGKESVKQSAGLGLGLYVAKIVIEQHKGKIWAESKGVGQGSSFIFSIPIKNNLSATTLLDLTQK